MRAVDCLEGQERLNCLLRAMDFFSGPGVGYGISDLEEFEQLLRKLDVKHDAMLIGRFCRKWLRHKAARQPMRALINSPDAAEAGVSRRSKTVRGPSAKLLFL